MKREKNHKTARFIEALEFIDIRFIEEAGAKIKERHTGIHSHGGGKKNSLRQILALAACIALLSAAIPAITYITNHLPDLIAAILGDETTEQTDPELTAPETPPTETSRTPETTVNTDPETTAPLYDGTTAEPEPEHNGSYGLEYKMNEDGKSAMLFHRGICTDENVIVASVWNGVPVTIIGEAAFADYIKYKTITIPESVTAIDMRAFKNCTGLESVVLHDGISYIGADAFKNCVALTEITLPKSLEWIQTGLFMNCINLQKVIIGNEVERIVFGAFYDCSALRELHYLGTKAEWNAIQKDETWNIKSAITVVHCTDGDVEITPYTPDEAVYDGSQGLEYKVNADGKTASLFGIGTCTDTEIVVASIYNGLPVTEIFYNAFNGNSQIVSVIIPESVTFIDKRAFANCSSLESITLPSGLKNFGEAETFKNCTSLKTIVLPDGMNYLGVETFKGCTSLESIVMKGVGSIDISAFEDCAKLNNIVISGKCIDISDSAFKNCISLTNFSFDGTVNEWLKLAKGNEWSDGCPFTVIHCSDGDVNLIIEYDGSRGLEYRIEGDHAVLVGIGTCTDKDIVTATTYNGLPVTGIDSFEISGNKGITSVTVSEGVTHIEVCAFSGCPDLRAVYLPSTLQFLSAGEGIAFENCDNIDTIKVADSNPKYYSVGNCLIERGTGNLVLACSKSVLPSDGSIKSIGQFAFGGSDSLEKIVIPEGVTVINPYAFAGCASLKSVTFPDSLTTVRWDAFANCTSLESVKLGDNVTEIGSRVFSGCSSLVDITLPGHVDSFGEEIFAGCPIESIVIPDGVKTLHGGMFANCRKLKSVTLPDGIETIVGFAFAYCSSLEKITLPRSVTKIQGEVFADCSNLTEFTFKGTKAEWNAIEKQDGWNDGCPFTVIHCSDGDVFSDPISYDEATELARQYWSPIESGYFVCYASDEMYLLVRPDEVIVDRIYIDRYTGEISVPKLTYPDIPDSLLKVLLNETTYIRQFDYESEGYFKDTVLDYPTAETGSFGYAVCDLDGDGKAELILSSMQYEIVLREFEGKVYGYLFDFRSLLDLKTDGSFNFISNAGMTYGTARLSFDGTKYVYHELTRRETADDGSISYFVDDKKVTKEEFDAREALLSQEEAPYEHLAIYPLRAWFPGG